ncbi:MULTISPECIES: hypothetical protein [Streptomyces]|uniref:Secreted protein n=1 Tax=Streptomyces chengmaiensis TaxID=3040919 RepID=A0ABT6HHR7_9ACTN|nr:MULTISPECIES: hypothetical protein [Streptomyces]MDH2388303.1 hypothetical protein [Streptomyces chengmaiensis]WRQ82589.1 hypothetical protein I3F59_026330 [Streptomyces sp. MUM 178J]
MASIRTARVLAAVAALPLTALMFSGVAQADNGAGADDGSISNAITAAIVGSGVGDDNKGNSTTTQQVANGSGATNQNNTAAVNDADDVNVEQVNAVVTFTNLW